MILIVAVIVTITYILGVTNRRDEDSRNERSDPVISAERWNASDFLNLMMTKPWPMTGTFLCWTTSQRLYIQIANIFKMNHRHRGFCRLQHWCNVRTLLIQAFERWAIVNCLRKIVSLHHSIRRPTNTRERSVQQWRHVD